MRHMSDLSVILLSRDVDRCRAALTLCNSQAALGGRVRAYWHETSVALLARGPIDDDPPGLAETGLPDRLALLAMAHEAGVTLVACQTGLALTGLGIADLVDGVEGGGLVSFLAALGDARLVTI